MKLKFVVLTLTLLSFISCSDKQETNAKYRYGEEQDYTRALNALEVKLDKLGNKIERSSGKASQEVKSKYNQLVAKLEDWREKAADGGEELAEDIEDGFEEFGDEVEDLMDDLESEIDERT